VAEVDGVCGELQHSFAKEGHELSMGTEARPSLRQEDNHYSNLSAWPVTPTPFGLHDDSSDRDRDELTADYSYPLHNTQVDAAIHSR